MRATTFTLLCFATQAVLAQCGTFIPGDAVVIAPDAPAEIDQTEHNVWICPGYNGTVSGTSNTVFVEAGSSLVVSGSGWVIWTRGDVVIEGDGHTIHRSPGATVTFPNGVGSNTVTVCPDEQPDFDYVLAPVEGCFNISTGLVERVDGIRLSPQPFSDVVYFGLPGNERVLRVQCTDAAGRVHAVVAEGNGWSVPGLSSGACVFQVVTDKAEYRVVGMRE